MSESINIDICVFYYSIYKILFKQLIVRYYEWDGIDTNWISIYDSTYIPLDSSLLSRCDTSQIQTVKTFKNKFSIVEIPVIVGYLYKLNDFQISLKGGFITGFLIKSNGIIYKHDEFIPIQTKNHNKLLFLITGALGVNYRVYKEKYVFVDFCFRKQLNSIFEENIYYK